MSKNISNSSIKGNNNKKKVIILLTCLLIVGAIICLILTRDREEINSVMSIDDKVDLDNGDSSIDWNSLDSSLIELENKTINISNGGVYTIEGSINNGSIVVNTVDDVKLILNNVKIKNENGPAIIVEEANNVVIELAEGSINSLEDGDNYENSEYDGCIFSKDDLVIQGNGSLSVISNYLDGIVSNDDLKIVSGNITVDSQDDGIRGKDSVYIIDGDININSLADGIKATNDTDNTKGYVNIDGGNITITSDEDGIQAETKLIINDGNFKIVTGSGSSASNSAMDRFFYGGNNYDDTSSKGLKAGDNLVIKGGVIEIDSKDDAIHSNNYVGISSGEISISSGDDGIHADQDIIVDNGLIEILKSYEGIEASNITLNNGNITINASDDGVNISGGNDSSSVNNRPGQNNFSQSSGKLIINGGRVYVNASGDGLDANGSIEVNEGNVYVDGPTDNGNGPLDYDVSFDINGGNFIAVGSSGMAQNASDSSKQYSVMFNLSSTYSDKVSLVDSSGKTIFEYTPKKNYQSIVISTNEITKGSDYTLFIGDKEIDMISIDNITNSSGYGNGMNMHGGYMPNGGHGGGRR